MHIIKRISVLLFIIIYGGCFSLHAQEELSTYQKAAELYEIGQFEEVLELLGPALNEGSVKKADQANAYRIMALSCMQLHQTEGAQSYTTQLLMVNPNYYNSQDPPRFLDLINSLKKNSITIETASQQAESIEESPVPVTLITEDMIQASGAQSIRELLSLYIPGVNIIEGSSSNVALRGIYSSTQETLLILLNGQRLNSSINNTQALDQSNSLDKIKRIEVLRGPASSLYGNVALSAVVNIITKRGAELDGHQTVAKMGSFGQKGLSFMTGIGSVGQDIMAWGSFYSSTGQKQNLANTTHYIGGYNGKPTYDIGMRGNWKDLIVQFTLQHSKLVPYYPIVNLDDAWYYDKFGKVEGEKPGVYRKAMHGLVSWSHNWRNKSLKISTSIDSENGGIYNVMADQLDEETAAMILSLMGFENVTPMTQGIWQNMRWHSLTYSASVQGGLNYQWGAQYGNLLAGVQYERLMVDDGQLILGDNYNQTKYTMNGLLTEKPEETTSAYLQLKHNFLPSLILNGGLRYDYKKRINNSHLDNFSPRVALIWIPSKNVSLRMGYSHSFVDAPYLYRTSLLTIYSGGSELKPEKLDAYQLGIALNLPKHHMFLESNLFYNSVKNIIVYNSSVFNGSSYSMKNSGFIRMYGIENSWKYQTQKTLLNAILTYQHPNGKNEFTTDNSEELYNIPKLLLNLVAQQQLYNKKEKTIAIRGNLHIQDKMLLSDNSLIKNVGIVNYQSAYALLNLGAEYSYRSVKLSLDIYNLLDKDYKLGGMVKLGVPQQGRSILGKIQYNF